MKSPEDPDPLDLFLRENDGYIEDAGFTTRVVAALPPRRRSWLRPAILLGATLIGLAMAFLWMPSLKEIFTVGPQGTVWLDLSRQALLALGVLAVALGSLLWSLFAVLRWED